jgi:fibronectin type 3 domain-containing protein
MATFTPSTAGSATGSVTVASNAATDTIALSGTGAAAAASHSVVLSWTGATSVTGYNTYSSTVSGGPYTKLNSSQDTSTTYTDSTVQTGKTYFYVVTSVSSSNVESVYSSEISATIP